MCAHEGIHSWLSLVCGSAQSGAWSLRLGLQEQGRTERKHWITQYLAVVWPVIEGSRELTPGVVTYPDSVHSSMFVTLLSVCAVYSEKLREGL